MSTFSFQVHFTAHTAVVYRSKTLNAGLLLCFHSHNSFYIKDVNTSSTTVQHVKKASLWNRLTCLSFFDDAIIFWCCENAGVGCMSGVCAAPGLCRCPAFVKGVELNVKAARCCSVMAHEER